ncbi:MAG: Asp-tRNA(Asn)/Glu-tRNA(Gln) amidotransferase subunit GatA [Deltaproteobacteria bacterium]|jgi:aspartyl-tRNA(Asn)/glutamyl-tRNA(Gln) amidotransferase subunit A|nr:Asp-tRNA(Asn)/Glu-tRNA(Gln) amidotransferase subunit GatA [Deltaproteobacteria bacterium]
MDKALCSLSLEEARKGLLRRDFTAFELVESLLRRIRETEPALNACLAVFEDESLKQARAMDESGPDPSKALWAVPVTLKDVYNLQGAPATAGSRMLKDYLPSYEATVVKRLREAGAILIAKTNLDEFAMGSSTEFSAYGPTRNPRNLAVVPGGSSGGAAAGVAAGQAPGAFGTDTGGSIRQPAALCGCVGLKPSYGRVSRYGIIAYGSSLDQAGPLARTVSDCGRLLSAVAGPDGLDSTCSRRPPEDYVNLKEKAPGSLTLALPRELWEASFHPAVKETLDGALELLKAAGVGLKTVSMPALRYSVAVYYILAAAEASTNLARYDGARYGYRAEKYGDLSDMYKKSRTGGLGREVRRRILLGTFVLSSGYYDAYYKKAAQARRLIRDEYLKTLEEADFILAPVSSIPAWPFGSFTEDPLTQYQLDIMTLPLNLAGGPGLSLPCGEGSDGLPVGVQLMGEPFKERSLLEAGLALERMFPKPPDITRSPLTLPRG